jgi:hypothetical protein
MGRVLRRALITVLLGILLCSCGKKNPSINVTGIDMIRVVHVLKDNSEEVVENSSSQIVPPLLAAITASKLVTGDAYPVGAGQPVELFEGQQLRHVLREAGGVIMWDGNQYRGGDRLRELVESAATGVIIKAAVENSAPKHGEIIRFSLSITNIGDDGLVIPAKGECRVSWYVPWGGRGGWRGSSDRSMKTNMLIDKSVLVEPNQTAKVYFEFPSARLVLGSLKFSVTELELERKMRETVVAPECLLRMKLLSPNAPSQPQ